MSPAANLSRDSRLRLELETAGFRSRPLWGCSPDFQHQEKSWAVLMHRDQALALGHKLEQNAIYWVDRDLLFLTPCLMQEEDEECLGLFSERVHRQAPMGLWPKPR
ncbi:DUF3293 domain-containing protein [Gallaecimonas sp. GXIMD4217]|uniref:DUF3293 domain-containing protein n=1 Tax=Gallaecimonas sp. GXIMD4217 TaxID=3131927 RepID=UPI00311B1CAE